MNLNQWLSEATGSYPAGVQRRLAQEYRAHWEESGGGDAVAVFGKPGVVRRRLKRSYFTAEEFGFVNGAGEWVFWAGVISMVACAALLSSTRSSIPISLPNILLFGMLLGFWAYSRHWNRTRRAHFRLLGSGLAPFLFLLQDLQWSEAIGIVGAAVLLSFWLMPREDARLRRTLELEGVFG